MEYLSCGVAINPVNGNDGRTLIHELCRRNDISLFNVVFECYQKTTSTTTASLRHPLVQVCDHYGRTPLHDVCASMNPSFEIVNVLFRHDPNLIFMADCNGILPLECIPNHTWSLWIQYLHEMLPVYLPTRDVVRDGPQSAPSLTLVASNSYPCRHPNMTILPTVASMVANGHISPQKAKQLARLHHHHHRRHQKWFSEKQQDDTTTTYGTEDDTSCSSIGEKEILTFLTKFHAEHQTIILDDICHVVQEIKLIEKNKAMNYIEI
jgi:hypothetical protein